MFYLVGPAQFWEMD